MVETPFTQGIAGWFGGETISFPHLEVTTDNPFAVVVVSSVGPEPIATAKRLLVTVIGRVEPTGFRWVDRSRRDVADPGRPPFLQEPVFAHIAWRRQGKDPGPCAEQCRRARGPSQARAPPRRCRGHAGHRRQDPRLPLGAHRRVAAPAKTKTRVGKSRWQRARDAGRDGMGSRTGSPGQMRSFSAFNAWILITLRAGLALMVIGCLVAGLNPARAGVAGLCTTLILKSWGT